MQDVQFFKSFQLIIQYIIQFNQNLREYCCKNEYLLGKINIKSRNT